MNEDTRTYLTDIIFRVNMLLDSGESATFEDVYSAIKGGEIIEWLSDAGTDMSILLSGKMDDIKADVVEKLQGAATARKGSERRKMGVQNNGYCLIIGLALEALAFDED